MKKITSVTTIKGTQPTPHYYRVFLLDCGHEVKVEGWMATPTMLDCWECDAEERQNG